MEAQTDEMNTYDRSSFFKDKYMNTASLQSYGSNVKIHSIRYDPTDTFIALGCDDGLIRIVKED